MSQDEVTRYEEIRFLWAVESFEHILNRPPSAEALSRMRETIEVETRPADTKEIPQP